MDLRTSEITLQAYGKVSPYQMTLNRQNKEKVLSQFDGKMKFIWAVPIGITLSELVLLKYGKVSPANKLALYKWISYIMATVATNFSSAEALRKCEYFERLYPRAPQIQREQIRDAEILKRTVDV